jgi:hypothetical protein
MGRADRALWVVTLRRPGALGGDFGQYGLHPVIGPNARPGILETVFEKDIDNFLVALKITIPLSNHAKWFHDVFFPRLIAVTALPAVQRDPVQVD